MEEIILGVSVNTEGSKQPIAELESALKKMKENIKTLPSDSQAFKVLQNEIRKTDAELKNVNKGLEGLTKEKISEGLSKIAGGASAAVAGFSLLSQAFGTSKQAAEEMQKSFNMAFGVVTGVKGLIETFQGLATVMPIVNTAMSAFNAIMRANPIGLIVTVVIALAGALTLLASSTEDADEATASLNERLKEENEDFEKVNEKLLEASKRTREFTNAQVQAQRATADFRIGLISSLESLSKFNSFGKAFTELTAVEKAKLSLGELRDLFNKSSAAAEENRKKLIDNLIQANVLIDKSQKNIKKLNSEIGNVWDEDYFSDAQKNLRENLKFAQQSIKEATAEKANLIKTLDNANKSQGIYIGLIGDEIKKREKLGEVDDVTKKNKEDLNKKREEEISKYRELISLLNEIDFLQRKNATRQSGGPDEQRFLDLLDKEKAFTEEKKRIDENELLDTEQKAKYQKAILEQYYLDRADINKKYADAEAKARQEEYDKWLAAEKEKNKKLLAEQEKSDEELSNGFREFLKKRNDDAKKAADARIAAELAYVDAAKQGIASLAAYQASVQEGQTIALESRQKRELETFEKNQAIKYTSIQEGGVNILALEKQLDEEKRLFLIKQEEDARQLRKKQETNALRIQAIASIGEIAAAIIKAQKLPPPLNIAEGIRIAALGITQIAAINSSLNKISSYARGGIIDGPSHANGGVKFAVGGQVNELEGGEGVINKRSMAIPGIAQAASFLNQMGGGVSFNQPSSNSSSAQMFALASVINSSPQMIEAYVLEGNVTATQRNANRTRNRAKF